MKAHRNVSFTKSFSDCWNSAIIQSKCPSNIETYFGIQFPKQPPSTSTRRILKRKCCTKLIFWAFQQSIQPRKKTIAKMYTKKRELLNNNIQPTKKQYGKWVREQWKLWNINWLLLFGCCSLPWTRNCFLYYHIMRYSSDCKMLIKE